MAIPIRKRRVNLRHFDGPRVFVAPLLIKLVERAKFRVFGVPYFSKSFGGARTRARFELCRTCSAGPDSESRPPHSEFRGFVAPLFAKCEIEQSAIGNWQSPSFVAPLFAKHEIEQLAIGNRQSPAFVAPSSLNTKASNRQSAIGNLQHLWFPSLLKSSQPHPNREISNRESPAQIPRRPKGTISPERTASLDAYPTRRI
jgi:hypothetical protein